MTESFLEDEEQILRAAAEQTMAAYKADPSTDNLRRFQAAKKAIELHQSQQTSAAEQFKNVEQAASWIVDQGFLTTARTVRNHAKGATFPRRQKDGSYLKADILEYAEKNWENPSRREREPEAPKGDINEKIKQETLRKLQIENDKKLGSLIPLADEIRRRVNIIAGLKIAMQNERSFFQRELARRMRHDGHDEATADMVNLLVAEAAHLYEDIVLRVFHQIGKRGGVEVVRVEGGAGE